MAPASRSSPSLHRRREPTRPIRSTINITRNDPPSTSAVSMKTGMTRTSLPTTMWRPAGWPNERPNLPMLSPPPDLGNVEDPAVKANYSQAANFLTGPFVLHTLPCWKWNSPSNFFTQSTKMGWLQREGQGHPDSREDREHWPALLQDTSWPRLRPTGGRDVWLV